MNSSETAEEIVKLYLEGMEVALRITGKGAAFIASLIYEKAKENKMTKGKASLNNMLKSGEPLQIFSLKEEHLKKFNEEAKKYGVLYTLIKNNKNSDGLVDIMVRATDAPKVNRIVDRFNLATVDIASIKSEIEKDKIDELEKDAKERGIPIKSIEEKVVDEILSKPIKKEENENSNPQEAKMEKSPLSEPSSESKKDSGVVFNNKKPSVRETLKEIKTELETNDSQKEMSKDEKETTHDKLKDTNGNDKNVSQNSTKNKKERKNKNVR